MFISLYFQTFWLKWLDFFQAFQKRFGLWQKKRFYVSVFLNTAQLFFPIKTFHLDSLQKNANNAFLKFIALSQRAAWFVTAGSKNVFCCGKQPISLKCRKHKKPRPKLIHQPSKKYDFRDTMCLATCLHAVALLQCIWFWVLFILIIITWLKPFKSRVRHFSCRISNPITHQTIQLESCSNPLRIEQVW